MHGGGGAWVPGPPPLKVVVILMACEEEVNEINRKRAEAEEALVEEFTVDLEQSEQRKRFKTNGHMPTVLTHGVYWNQQVQVPEPGSEPGSRLQSEQEATQDLGRGGGRPLMKEEIPALQGLPVLPGLHVEDPKFLCGFDSSMFSTSETIRMGGNAMNAQLLFMIRCYISACIERTDVVEPPQTLWVSDSDSESLEPEADGEVGFRTPEAKKARRSLDANEQTRPE